MTTDGRGHVLVTGGSSGIGEATVWHLRDLGFSVFAGVRHDEDAERLCAHGVTPIRLDVTVAEQIAAARTTVGDKPLAGLVNNAGIVCTGPLEFVSVEDFRRQLDVNVIGQFAVTQAFVGALRAGRGRIVNVGSLSGRFATPATGPYVTSKFALEGMTDVLRRELLREGIGVVMVQPGGVKTRGLNGTVQGLEQIYRDASPELLQRYGAMLTKSAQYVATINRHIAMDASGVAKVIGKALTVRRPRTRYLVGPDAIIAAALAKVLPDRVTDWLLLSQLKSE